MIKLKDRMQAKPIIDPPAMRAMEWKVIFESTGVMARVLSNVCLRWRLMFLRGPSSSGTGQV